MRATLDYVRRKFDEFNVRMFDGRLTPPAIKLTTARSYLGMLAFTRQRTAGGVVCGNFTLKISVCNDLPEKVVEDTVIHEMIHYHILSNRLNDSSAHGPVFRKIMADINSSFGRNITVSHTSTRQEKDSDLQLRRHLVCLCRFADTTLTITVTSPGSIFRLWDAIEGIPNIVSRQWFATNDPYFNRFPRARTPKFYRADPDELQPHILGVYPLHRVGPRISPMPKTSMTI